MNSSRKNLRYVILRDDDTNALTPIECLEQLYRPWLERGLPVNLATIPAVRTDAHRLDGSPEGFLRFAGDRAAVNWLPFGANAQLTDYLHRNPGFRVVQHGYDHSLYEFAGLDEWQLGRRLDEGARLLAAAGFPGRKTFVAPYDKFSRAGLRAAAQRFSVVSSGWFELRRLPIAWWPAYVWRKISRHPHWRAGRTMLLSHPGCLLSCFRPRVDMLDQIKRAIVSRRLTVLVTHWWEYFPGGRPDEDFIRILHQTAAQLAGDPEVRVVSFDDLAAGRVPLN